MMTYYDKGKMSLIVGPSTPVEFIHNTYGDREPIELVRLAGTLDLQFSGGRDNLAGEIAAIGNLIDALEQARSAMHERMRQAFPDGLEPATMADVLAGWSEAEKAGAFGK